MEKRFTDGSNSIRKSKNGWKMMESKRSKTKFGQLKKSAEKVNSKNQKKRPNFACLEFWLYLTEFPVE